MKQVLKFKTKDMARIEMKAGSLIVDGEPVYTFENSGFKAESSNFRKKVGGELPAGEHTAALVWGSTKVEEKFTTTEETKKVIFNVKKKGFWIVVTGYKLQIKVK